MIFLSIFSIIKKAYYFLSYTESNFFKEMKGVGQAVWEEEGDQQETEGAAKRLTENELNALYTGMKTS